MTYRAKYKGYKCVNSQMGGQRCTAHGVKEEYLVEFMKKNLKEIIDKNINKDKYYDLVKDIRIDNNFEKELVTVEQQLSTLDDKFQKLYEDKLMEAITERNFSNMVAVIQDKQEKLLKRKKELDEILSNNSNVNDVLQIYKDEIEKVLEVKEIDRALVETLIDKIIVTENKEKKEKTVETYFKFSNSQC